MEDPLEQVRIFDKMIDESILAMEESAFFLRLFTTTWDKKYIPLILQENEIRRKLLTEAMIWKEENLSDSFFMENEVKRVLEHMSKYCEKAFDSVEELDAMIREAEKH